MGAVTSANSARQSAAALITGVGRLAPVFASGGQMRNGLPATSMDSFVYEAAENAELIYGDEGVTDIPPYNEFTVEHRINRGIYDMRDRGLTTGHGSWMPDAWGNDEFLGAEWSQSGSTGASAPPPVPPGQQGGAPQTASNNPAQNLPNIPAIPGISIPGLPNIPGIPGISSPGLPSIPGVIQEVPALTGVLSPSSGINSVPSAGQPKSFASVSSGAGF
jgi:hypothetical protein